MRLKKINIDFPASIMIDLLETKFQKSLISFLFLYFQIGKIKDLDIFTRNFIMRSGNPKEQERIIRETVLKINILPPAKRFTADYYVEIMRSVLKQGEGFLDQEITRIDKMMLAEMLDKHKDEMTEKRNILQHFRSHRNQFRKDEL